MQPVLVQHSAYPVLNAPELAVEYSFPTRDHKPGRSAMEETPLLSWWKQDYTRWYKDGMSVHTETSLQFTWNTRFSI